MSERPYEPLGMTTARWIAEVPVKKVSLNQLTFHQKNLSIEGLLQVANGSKSYSGDMYPHIVIHKGIWWVSDGHHRLVISIIRGLEEDYCRVLDLDNITRL